jgi:hypothetical protein
LASACDLNRRGDGCQGNGGRRPDRCCTMARPIFGSRRVGSHGGR